jgi:hypothetical protein
MDQGEQQQQQQRATPVRPGAPGHSAERPITPGRRLGVAADRLSRDAPLVEHLRRCGAKNPEQSAEKLVDQEFETLQDLLDFDPSDPSQLYDMLMKECGFKARSAKMVVKYCALFGATAVVPMVGGAADLSAADVSA